MNASEKDMVLVWSLRPGIHWRYATSWLLNAVVTALHQIPNGVIQGV